MVILVTGKKYTLYQISQDFTMFPINGDFSCTNYLYTHTHTHTYIYIYKVIPFTKLFIFCCINHTIWHMQEGQGRYQWKDGNHYIGEWKNGEICGKGVFVWTNGNRYDGYWEEGVPKGNGTFKWPDGSFYVGNWSKDPREQNGTYYPSGSSPDGNLEWDPQEVYTVDLSESRICPGEKVSILPSQKKLAVWRSSKAGDIGSGGERPRRMSVDGRVSVAVERPFDRMRLWEGEERGGVFGGRESGEENSYVGLNGNGIPRGDLGQQMRVPRKSKRQGETICKGHKNYELMLNLQLGIRYYLVVRFKLFLVLGMCNVVYIS